MEISPPWNGYDEHCCFIPPPMGWTPLITANCLSIYLVHAFVNHLKDIVTYGVEVWNETSFHFCTWVEDGHVSPCTRAFRLYRGVGRAGQEHPRVRHHFEARRSVRTGEPSGRTHGVTWLTHTHTHTHTTISGKIDRRMGTGRRRDGQVDWRTEGCRQTDGRTRIRFVE